MKKVLHRRPSASMVVALTALVVAMSGTAVAASLVSGDKLIKKHSLSGNRLRNHTITGTQVNLNKLGKVPSAKNADHATTATSATSAGTATAAVTAGSATSATNAGNATDLGGQPASAYLPSSALQRSGLVTVPTGTTAKPIGANGPLSVTIDCTASGGVTTATIKLVSTVANWLNYGTEMSAAGPVTIESLDDSGSAGAENADFTSTDALAPSGQTLLLDVNFGVNWPSSGECFYQDIAID